MKTLNDQLSKYAAYHRDPRNIATHYVGIPMIVVGVATLLSRPAFLIELGPLGATALSPATLVITLSVLFYALMDLRYAAVMAVLMGASGFAGAWFAAQSTALWLAAGLGFFAVGWLIQFVGHYFEGKKPAFVDDLVGLLVGPLFVVAEAGFIIKLRDEVRVEIEKRVGPVTKRDMSVKTVKTVKTVKIGAAAPQ